MKYEEITELTFPRGNFFKKSGDLFVSPKTKFGAIFTLAPLY